MTSADQTGHPPGCQCYYCCPCDECKARRGESIYGPPPDEIADPAGAAVRIIEGITDRVELAALALLQLPNRETPTREVIARQVVSMVKNYDATGGPVDLAEALRAVDALLACGLLVEDADGELEISDLVYALKRREE